jgi:hypothetical protein
MGDKSAYTRHLLVEELIKNHGKGAHAYALERMLMYQDDELIVGMWRKVLNELDEYNQEECGK